MVSCARLRGQGLWHFPFFGLCFNMVCWYVLLFLKLYGFGAYLVGSCCVVSHMLSIVVGYIGGT